MPQSDRAIAGLVFSKYQTGSVRISPEIELFKMADAGRSRFANFLLETQSNSCPGDEGPQFELSLDI